MEPEKKVTKIPYTQNPLWDSYPMGSPDKKQTFPAPPPIFSPVS